MNYAVGSEPWSALQQLYPHTEVTALQGRAFGIWTLIETGVRYRAAYELGNKPLYELAWLTFAAATFHWVLEWLWFL